MWSHLSFSLCQIENRGMEGRGMSLRVTHEYKAKGGEEYVWRESESKH